MLALKWVLVEKLRDYLLGSKLTIYTVNNPLAYVKDSRVGEAQTWRISGFLLYNFDTK